MEDEDSSSREGLTPLTTVKVRISYVFCTKTEVGNPQSVPFVRQFIKKKNWRPFLVHDFPIINYVESSVIHFLTDFCLISSKGPSSF